MFLKWLFERSHVASVKFLPQLAWLLLKWLVKISHVALFKSLAQLDWLFLKFLIVISLVAPVKSLPQLAWLLLKWIVEISHAALVIIVLIRELVFNEKVELNNIVGSVKIKFGKSLPQLAWLFWKWLIEISHVA